MITRQEKFRKFYKAVWHAAAVRAANPVPVFVFGEMRSGTNMLTDCLDRSMQTVTYNESDDDAFRDYALLDNQKIAALINSAKGSHVTFKSLADSARAVELLDLFPSAKAIWIFRNFDDVVNSAMRKWTEHRAYLAYIIENPEKAAWRAMNLPPSLVELIKTHYARGVDDTSARALIWYVRNSLYFEQGLDVSDRVQLVRYEYLAQNPREEFERAFGFLGLPLSESYYEEVSVRSISRDPAPNIDPEIKGLCQGLFDQLDALTKRQQG